MKIQYKVKVKKDVDGREYIVYKKRFNKNDFVGKPHENPYYNSDIFTHLLKVHHKKAVEEKTWCFLDELPAAVEVDNSKFLAVVNINA